MAPLISIILPFYNAQKYLSEAIDSITESTFKEFELLLIDDGSCDAGTDIAEKYANSDSRIQLLTFKHKGLVAALNAGIYSAQTDIIARMDADDICLPDRFEKQFKELADNPGISLTSCLIEPVSDKPLTEGSGRYFQWLNNSIASKNIVRDLFIESPLIHSSTMFRKAAVTKVGLYIEYGGPEDYDLWLRMAEADMKFSKIPKVLLKYRVHPLALSRTDTVHYHKNAFLKRKLQYVLHNLTNGKLAKNRILRICGFGREGKKLLNYLRENKIPVDAIIDIALRKQNSMYKNIPILPPENVGQNDATVFYLCMIRKWGILDELRDFFGGKGKVEQNDYLLL